MLFVQPKCVYCVNWWKEHKTEKKTSIRIDMWNIPGWINSKKYRNYIFIHIHNTHVYALSEHNKNFILPSIQNIRFSTTYFWFYLLDLWCMLSLMWTSDLQANSCTLSPCIMLILMFSHWLEKYKKNNHLFVLCIKMSYLLSFFAFLVDLFLSFR